MDLCITLIPKVKNEGQTAEIIVQERKYSSIYKRKEFGVNKLHLEDRK